jgi:hypothetical protein
MQVLCRVDRVWASSVHRRSLEHTPHYYPIPRLGTNLGIIEFRCEEARQNKGLLLRAVERFSPSVPRHCQVSANSH